MSYFVPPTFKTKDYEAIPEYVWGFIKKHNPVLGACGNRFVFLNGVDVYGTDMLIPLLQRLRNSKFPNCGLLFVAPKVENRAYFEDLKTKIFFMDLNSHFLFVQGEREAYPIWSHLNLFIRPTCSDADTISVRECLSVGVPVIASDCVERPKGVVAFKSRNLEDLEAKVKAVLSDIDNYKVVNRESSGETFIQIFEGAK